MADYEGAERFILRMLEEGLSTKLTYHSMFHMHDVIAAAMRIAAAEDIDEAEKNLLRVACAFHDAGFLYLYRGHEEKSCEMAREFLPQFSFNADEINLICGMIMATRLPQQPHTLPEQIIADADLDYLGRDDFYQIGSQLFKEFMEFGFVNNEQQWNEVQLNFLQTHHYHTHYSREHRLNLKLQHLREIEAVVKEYHS